MAIELLPESTGVVPKNEINKKQDRRNVEGVAEVEVSGNKDELQTGSYLPTVSYLQRIIGNIDPLFYFILCLSVVVLVGMFLHLLQRSEQQIGSYLTELREAHAELEKKVAESEISSVAARRLVEVNAVPADVAGELVVRPKGISNSDSSGTAIDNNSTVSLSGPVEINDPVDELAALKILLHEKTQQVELLALENHELRLDAEFGSPTESAVTLSPVANTAEDKILPSDSVASSNSARSKSSFNDVEAPATDIDQFIDNGYYDYLAENYVSARDWYNQAVQIDPYNRNANLGVAAAATALGQYKLATDRYRHLLTLNGDDKEAFSAMLGLSATSSAIETELLGHIVNSARDPASLYSIMGHHFGQANRWADASAMFLRSLSTIGDDTSPADFYFNLAVSFQHTENPDKALEYYVLALNTPRGATFERAVALRQFHALSR